MFDETAPDKDPTRDQLKLISGLTDEEILTIDNKLYSNTADRWRKVARVVGTTMMEAQEITKELPDVFYSQRVYKLIESGKLEYQGQLNHMRYFEVRRITNET